MARTDGYADGVSGRLHPALRRALTAADDDASLPIVVEWQRDPMLARRAATAPDRLARRQQVIRALKADADERAAALKNTIRAAADDGLADNVRSFWVSPIIALEAKPKLIASLGRRDDVVQVRLDEPIVLEDEATLTPTSTQTATSFLWNLAMLDVGLAQDALGLDGTGVVVANVDTGVDWQHPALQRQYRGYNPKGPAVHAGNWYVATNEGYYYPGDGNGHGTHTMGSIVGDDGVGTRVGVAPGARWIAVKLFTNAGITYESWIHDAFQWIMAPNGDPTLAPDVVNNSWGSRDGRDERFRADVVALRAAGILPIFSAGNHGPDPGTVGSPASYPESFAVGAVDEENMITTFSSRGPSPLGGTKPNIVAPGANVLSAMPGGGYAGADGTSMAAPHVTGVAALLLQADPSLTPEELETILTTTAEPLGGTMPNNETGWGLVNAYAAGLRVTDSGELLVDVLRTDGQPIAHPTLHAAQRDGSQSVTVQGNADGRVLVALRPGRYDVTADAFGFESETAYSIEVITGTRTNLTNTLTQQPVGSVFGTVTEVGTGAPLSATLTVVDTPVETRSDANTGAYSLALPEGTWSLRVEAKAHRIGHVTTTVTAGTGHQVDVALLSAPEILLVDSGRWYYDSQISYFEAALEALDYPYRLWSVRNPFGVHDGPIDRPTTETLSGYDIVIWSAPLDSPGLIEAGGVISDYLGQGGRVLLSGQDVAYWDGGGDVFAGISPYFVRHLGALFESEGNLDDLIGEGVLDGLTLTLNTFDSAGQQRHPDAVVVRDSLMTASAARWPTSSIGGVTAGTCRPHRAAWLGAGLEGIGPHATRVGVLDRLLTWFVSPPAEYGLVVTGDDTPLIGKAGTTVVQPLRLDSTGIASDTFTLSITGGPWPLDLELPDGQHVDGDTDAEIALAGCTGATITVTVAIPPGEPRDTRADYILRFASQNDPSVVATATVRAKTPAPILIVDDERFYNYQHRYTQTVEGLGMGYDLLTTGADYTPPTDTLTAYPLVVWFTGYDWFAPLRPRDERRLDAYLDGGGRLLLSSQDLLDVRGIDDFVRNRLGVARATLSVTPTEVMAPTESPLDTDFGPWPLEYPYNNWSDAVYPAPGSDVVLRDENHFGSAVVRPAEHWRSAFFAFPLETLDTQARRRLLSRTLVWLSPLGESRLRAPPAAAEGSRIPITLTLGLADVAPRTDLRAVVPLLPETSFVSSSIRGPWTYDGAARTLVWQGDLAPEDTVTLTADLELAAPIADGTMLPLQARIYAGDGLTVTDEAPIYVDVPWLALGKQGTRTEAYPGETVRFTLTVANRGVTSTTARLTDTLPAGLEVVPGTVSASRGTVTSTNNVLHWEALVAPGETIDLTYTAIVTLAQPGAVLHNDARLIDDRGRRTVASTTTWVPAIHYLPLILKDPTSVQR